MRFARPGRIPLAEHAYLLDAFDKRRLADYDPDAQFSISDARQLLQRAREMRASAEALLA